MTQELEWPHDWTSRRRHRQILGMGKVVEVRKLEPLLCPRRDGEYESITS